MDIGNPSPRPELAPLCSKITREQVAQVVDAFYAKLRMDPELQHFFAHIPDFTAHQAHIADFWWIAMGGRVAEHQPFDMIGRHLPLGLSEDHIARWLELFHATLLELLPQELAEKWFQMAQGIGKNLTRILLGPAAK